MEGNDDKHDTEKNKEEEIPTVVRKVRIKSINF